MCSASCSELGLGEGVGWQEAGLGASHQGNIGGTGKKPADAWQRAAGATLVRLLYPQLHGVPPREEYQGLCSLSVLPHLTAHQGSPKDTPVPHPTVSLELQTLRCSQANSRFLMLFKFLKNFLI